MKNEKEIENQSEEMAIPEIPADKSLSAMGDNGLSWTNKGQMQFLYKFAKELCRGNAIPERFKNNPGDIIIAMDIASRTNEPLPMILNNMYPVYGQIGFNGQYVISRINNCGKFAPIDFVFNDDGTNCYATTTRLYDGKVLKGETISIEIAKKEGWYDKKGSKWQVYPMQMLRYRSAAFFLRAYCPELLYGYSTTDELQDLNSIDDTANGTVTISLNKDKEN